MPPRLLSCLIVDSDPDHAKELTTFCEAQDYHVIAVDSLQAVRNSLDGTRIHLAIVDLDLPDDAGLKLLGHASLRAAEIMVMSAQDQPDRVDQAVQAGASYFFCKPFQPNHLRPLLQDLITENSETHSPLTAVQTTCGIDQFGYLRGSSSQMRQLYRLARKVATTDIGLLLIGETGTGKELLAQTIHELSPRSDGPFIAVNCASVAETLLESELFGHEKGSFSGAGKRHLGFFERAQGGTLMLDEITEMNPELQSTLLRVLEEKKLRRVGSEEDIDIDVRIISATNRSPEEAVKDGSLRKDLYFRLAQFPLRLPPLRHRGEDIVGLAQYFLSELNTRHDTLVQFSESALDKINRHRWPGNVRQLKYVVEQAYIMSDSIIEPNMLPDPNLELQTRPIEGETIAARVGAPLADTERILILATLEKNKGDKKRTANQLGISLKTLYNRLKEYEPPAPAAPHLEANAAPLRTLEGGEN